jgi:eukaryotic-like serine/threonine-protein kinase
MGTPMSEVTSEEALEGTAIPKRGTVLAGKYEVERILGDGGMGVVVSARQIQLGRLVALKFLKREAAERADAAQRFLREARAASSISSEHVARVIDVGTFDDGRPFMVMEHLVGTDLSDVLRRQTIGIADAVGYTLQACEGLAAAHVAGIVHRDLKPSNLFLSRRADGDPLVKILDFGIAKAVDDPATDTSLTATGMALGSPIYMSPEQVRNAKRVDGRTDIWGLGVVLFEMLAGEPPFDAETVPALCAKIVADAPSSLRNIRPDVPEELEAVILRCLEKRPEDRYDDVAQLAEAIAPFAPEEARVLAERARRIVSGRASIPDIPPSFSESVEHADTVASGPGRLPSARDDSPRSHDTQTMWSTPPSHGPRHRATAIGIGAAVIVGVVVVLLVNGQDAPDPEPARSVAAEAPPVPAAPSADPTPLATQGKTSEPTSSSVAEKPIAEPERAPPATPRSPQPSPAPKPAQPPEPTDATIDPLGDRK